jgi:diguanylate cyclase (GGDEF)-like protein
MLCNIIPTGGFAMEKSSADIFTIEKSDLAECDYLTGLANRRGLYDYYLSLPRESILHAMFIDVDNFKRVNDIYGHSMGDRLLVNIARLIATNTHGFSSRIGGDEYVVILDGSLTKKDTEEIAKNLLTNLENMNFRKDILSLISLSIGIVLNQKASQPLDDILAKCDSAMYQAKYNGKNRYTVFKAYDKTLETNRNIEIEMDDALKNGDFKLFLQPKVNMVSSKLYGAEALSRWQHPVDGLRLPGVYIPLFEKNGFISKLDMYIYEEVCRLKASWTGKKYEHIPISFNMSRLHLYNKHFPDELEKIANKYGINTNELEIEITESTFIIDSNELVKMIDLLHEKGFLVSIDDFGSGFSALNLLKDLSVDTIKIDRQFLHVSSNDIRGKKVIRNVIAMCRDLKINVVTEGIETKEQIDFITRCGCQIAQGFYYAKPLPVGEFTDFANKYLKNILSSYTFRLNESLISEDGSLQGIINGEGLEFKQGIFSNSKSLYFPGGPTEKNTVYIPPTAIVNDSYTIALWIKPELLHFWSAALYVKFESGFCGIIPLAWEGHSDFRIQDAKEINGWYDISARQLLPDKWYHYVISYNAQTETATVFINGEVVNIMENVPTNRYVKWIILGGDIYQPSFIGHLCELVIYNETKDYIFVQELYDSYIQDKDFIAFQDIMSN